MLKKTIFAVMFLTTLGAQAQSEGIFPWVTNNTLFRGQLVLANLNDHEVEIILVATRADGSEEQVARTIEPFGQLVESTGSLFSRLGEGPGYRVALTSSDDHVDAALIISATGSASGSSPAQAEMISSADAHPTLLFPFLPISEQGSSAPVVVNTADSPALVKFHAFQNGEKLATSETFTIGNGRPFAETTANLFPGISGDIYVVAEGDAPLLGAAFIFNEQREPSMSGARAIPFVPQGGSDPAIHVRSIEGRAVTGINDLMGAPILDFGGDLGAAGFATVGAYDENGALTLDLAPSMLDNPASVILAAGAGLVPTVTDNFNVNVPLRDVPVVTGTVGSSLIRSTLPGMLESSQLDQTICEPYQHVGLPSTTTKRCRRWRLAACPTP